MAGLPRAWGICCGQACCWSKVAAGGSSGPPQRQSAPYPAVEHGGVRGALCEPGSALPDNFKAAGLPTVAGAKHQGLAEVVRSLCHHDVDVLGGPSRYEVPRAVSGKEEAAGEWRGVDDVNRSSGGEEEQKGEEECV